MIQVLYNINIYIDKSAYPRIVNQNFVTDKLD